MLKRSLVHPDEIGEAKDESDQEACCRQLRGRHGFFLPITDGTTTTARINRKVFSKNPSHSL